MYDWFPCDSSARSQEAPTIVFIHGWLLSRRYWEPVISQLKAEFSCLSYDLRGFGDAPIESNRTDYSLQAYAQDLKWSSLARWSFPRREYCDLGGA